jgi:hypothetical protein
MWIQSKWISMLVKKKKKESKNACYRIPSITIDISTIQL